MPTPLLTIASAGINLGDRWLLRGADLTLHAGDRLALVGRNGAGKSSLMKLMAGTSDMDEGSYWMAPGASVAYLPQAPVIPPGMTLRSVVIAGHDADWLGRPVPIHKAEEFLQRLGLDPDRLSDGLSGGEARRVSLARALYTEPDVLLLDEPTNHMDMPTIEWMEEMLRRHRGALLVVSHDRAFLRNLGTGIVWLHNGKLRRREGDFGQFDDWSERILAEEAVVLHKMDRRIAAETKWSREGISARRKRNQGRLRELEALRLERPHRRHHAARDEDGDRPGRGRRPAGAGGHRPVDLGAAAGDRNDGSGEDDRRRAAPAPEPFQHAGAAKRPHRHRRAERHRQIDPVRVFSAMPTRTAGGSARASASTRPISTSSGARSTAIPRPGPCSPAAAAT